MADPTADALTTSTPWVDSHCHLDFSEFDKNRTALLEECEKAGIGRFLIPGTRAASWSKQISLQQQFPQCDLAFGLHPYFLNDVNPMHFQQLESLLASHSKVCALGEIGLDYAIEVPTDVQLQALDAQLALAKQFALPIILHQRKAHHHLIRSLKAQVPIAGVVHAFSGSLQQAEDYLALGIKLGIGGTISYPRAQKTRTTVAAVPLDMLLLETDSPDMPLYQQQGKANTPMAIPQVARHLAQLKGISERQVRQQCWQNYRSLFMTHGR